MNKSEQLKQDELAEKVVDIMYSGDYFSQWLGIERSIVKQGFVVLKMTIRKDMLNGFNIMHGGISYSLADSALAFAANSYGRVSVTLDAIMHYPSSAKEGDTLTATAQQVSLTNKTALFDVIIKNQDDVLIGTYRGTVYRTLKEF